MAPSTDPTLFRVDDDQVIYKSKHNQWILLYAVCALCGLLMVLNIVCVVCICKRGAKRQPKAQVKSRTITRANENMKMKPVKRDMRGEIKVMPQTTKVSGTRIANIT